jgi:hypothetical protein
MRPPDMPSFKDPLGIEKSGKRAYVRRSVKEAVWNSARGKCEYTRCKKNLRWGNKGTGKFKGNFHHIRSPSIPPTEKTVRLVCPDHHSSLHEYKSKKEYDPFFGDRSKRKTIRIDPIAKPKKKEKQETKKKRTKKRKTGIPDFSKLL